MAKDYQTYYYYDNNENWNINIEKDMTVDFSKDNSSFYDDNNVELVNNRLVEKKDKFGRKKFLGKKICVVIGFVICVLILIYLITDIVLCYVWDQYINSGGSFRIIRDL